ncbi:MAG: glycosyltransferase family 4 protein [Deltaproteobacteria bacterium]|nr:glycosyltransferase family 4 protein [Deltaproteobacteria bacterium]
MSDNEKRKVCFLSYNYSPYSLARCATAANYGQKLNTDLIAIEIISQDEYGWQSIYNGEGYTGFKKYTLINSNLRNKWLTFIAVKKLCSLLNEVDPQVIAILGYDNPVTIAGLLWGRLNRRIKILMMDSKFDDMPRSVSKEWLKRKLISIYDGAIVSGLKSREYAKSLGIPENMILTGFDVVDNQHFADRSEWARNNEIALRQQHQLPENYFLCVSRLIEKKNLDRLLDAYEIYAGSYKGKLWDLVICGSGPLEQRLKEKVMEKGFSGVHLVGTKTYEEMPIFYGLAKCLILPSAFLETWGLVVNEAMAAGLPVLVSKACGCYPDLIEEGVNGYSFDPYNVEELAELMVKASSGECDLGAMGEASRRIIADWTLEAFAHNFFKVVEISQAPRQTPLLG